MLVIHNFCKKNYDRWLVFFLIIVFTVFFSFLSFERHDSLKSYMNDLGTYDQIIWNTAYGHFFQMTAGMVEEDNYLGAHFSPILLFFVPFYLLFSSPKWFLFFQALAVGLSAVPIYYFSKEKLKNKMLALGFLLSFLLNPVIQNGLLYDFHEVVFAAVFASWAFYFLEKGKDKWFIFFSILLALSQEHLPLLVFMMGLYIAFFKKRYKFGLAVSAGALVYFLSVLMVLMPHFSSSGTPALLANNSAYPSRYAWLGKSMPEIAKNIFTHPLAILFVLFSHARIWYIFQLVMPVFSLALYSAPILIILPLILINLLSNNSMTFDITFYHSVILVPFIYFSAVCTFKKWFLDSANLKKMFFGLILIFSLASAILYSVSPLSFRYSMNDFFPSEHARKINEIKKIIPSQASLSVQHNLGPHFTEREKIYRFPLKRDEVEYVLVDMEDPYKNNPNQVFKFQYALQEDIKLWEGYVEELRKSSGHEIIFDNGGYILFKRK